MSISQYMETLPIPEANAEQKQVIATLAEECQRLAEQRYQLEERMCRRMTTDLCPPDRGAKLSQKLQTWWQLSFADFHAELKKCFKIEIPLKARDEWEDLLSERTQQVKDLTAQLTAKEALLNQSVYALFGLTAKDITLLEASLCKD